jgi:AhpD family alkylhydroperoxidase
MARIPPITSGEDLDPDRRAVFDRIVESRGEVSRPFSVLLHAPAIAGRVAELGHVVRFGSGLAEADRELITLAAGRALGCAFVWDSHVDAARSAGLSPDTIAALEGDRSELPDRERVLVTLVDEVVAAGPVRDRAVEAALALLGTTGTVEAVATVGYYAMLASVMRAFDAC